ncbi:hypothetical protein QUA86_31905 [Microcoleus sp. F6_B6]
MARQKDADKPRYSPKLTGVNTGNINAGDRIREAYRVEVNANNARAPSSSLTWIPKSPLREKRRAKTQAIKQCMMPELSTPTTRIIDN